MERARSQPADHLVGPVGALPTAGGPGTVRRIDALWAAAERRRNWRSDAEPERTEFVAEWRQRLTTRADTLAQACIATSVRAGCRAMLRRIDLRVEGAEHVPTNGPVIIAARHFHYIYDGCALLATVPRPVRAVVTLDWTRHPVQRHVLTAACSAAGWPIVPRSDAGFGGVRSVRGSESFGALREGVRGCVAHLRAGRVVLVFPEAYPTIDPRFTPKIADDEFLPFRPGFARLATLAECDGQTRVPIVPAGLEYARGARWRLTLRFGRPVWASGATTRERFVEAVAEQVRALSGAVGASVVGAPSAIRIGTIPET
ncbi:MAG: 1-acyl-sn-glycerol-3-phosphate acyltransferase [Thermomicrobiales bacterium]|nr:1-acyl-sn-glycerol-3-phosphate acyltransferase [Thermomicrobiales bacterium]